MATISGKTNEKVYGIARWLGLNEHPDGDTRLKIGEASKMVNWKITRDGNLKLRPGMEFISGLCGQYDLKQDSNITSIGVVDANDQIEIFNNPDASTGTITFSSDFGGLILDGRWKNLTGGINSGELILGENSWSVSDGELVYSGSGSSVYTIHTLYEILQDLEPGEYLYCYVNGTPYAINDTSLSPTGEGAYYFGGYVISSVPHVNSTAKTVSMWSGVVGGEEVLLAACDSRLWKLYDADTDAFVKEQILIFGEEDTTINTDKDVGFFPFDGKVYILNGYEYYVYDGTNLEAVEGYRPLVAIAIGPLVEINGVLQEGAESGVTTGEYINRLNGNRRVWISPDGTGKVFQLPEKNLTSVSKIIDLATGTAVTSGWSATTSTGRVEFTTAPTKAVNSYEIWYEVSDTYRSDVTGNLYAELYSGTTDTRIFLYGDGTNRTIYSGMDYDGMPRADYFPDQYEVRVGDSNTPITAMVRHYGSLICFKPTECWSLQHGIVELATNELTPAVYCVPVNRDRGNIAPGQVRLVENSPVTCCGTELYHWINSSYYTSNLSRDERQAQRISDRISRSIKEIDFKTAIMWDDNDNQEFYIVQNKVALVWNYAANAWYRYENFDATAICNFHGDLYIGTSEGKIYRMSEDVIGDEGVAIKAEWESGAMDFGADYMRKYASTLWVGLKPEHGTSVKVCVETDRKNTFFEKEISSEKAKIQGQPFMVKAKIKAKKFEYYRLMLSSNKKQLPVTVTNVDIRVRTTGYAK